MLQNRIELKGKFTGMTVKELKKFIEHLPDDMDVMVEQSNDESRYGMAQSAVAMEVSFQNEDIPKDECAERLGFTDFEEMFSEAQHARVDYCVTDVAIKYANHKVWVAVKKVVDELYKQNILKAPITQNGQLDMISKIDEIQKQIAYGS